jgi:hypothetical protein
MNGLPLSSLKPARHAVALPERDERRTDRRLALVWGDLDAAGVCGEVDHVQRDERLAAVEVAGTDRLRPDLCPSRSGWREPPWS